MDHINVEEFRRITVLLRRQQRNGDPGGDSKIPGKITVRPPLTTHSKAVGSRSFVSRLNRQQLAAALTLFCLVHSCLGHSAHSSSSSCVEFRKVAAEHTIQSGEQKFTCHRDGLAPEKHHSSGGGGRESSWSCIDLETSEPRQPFFLQSPTYRRRSHAGTGKDSAPSTSSLGKSNEGLSEQLRTRKLRPIAKYSAKEECCAEVVPDVMVVEIATTCSNDHTPSSSSILSRLMLDPKNLPLEVPCSPWRCNSTVVAQSTTTTRTGASITRFLTDSVTASIHFSVSFSREKTASWLLRILDELDEQLQSTYGDGDGPKSIAEGRMTGRRSLMARSWKPVIVTDAVIVVIGFVLAVSALSCWVRQRNAVKSDAAISLPVSTPSNPVVTIATGSDQNLSARSGSGLRMTGPGICLPVEAGRWSPVDEGLGRWDRAETDGRPTEPEGVEKRPGRWERVEAECERPAAKKGSGRGPRVAEMSPGNRARVSEGGPGTGSRVLRSREVEGETTAATAHRSREMVRYRAEPFGLQGLAAATGDFDKSNILGQGGFGTVYRGLLFDGRVVAIKRADRNSMLEMVDKQCAFKAELDVMSRLHHKHLVNLVGYCDECDEMMLVYEYMPNGTLADHLHNKSFKSRALSSWKVRIRVALQAARGIEYLHTYAEPPVIHRDIKSSNMLLDAKGSVRVSDFGLCFIFPTASEGDLEDETVQLVSTKAAGTMGYMDPEYYHDRHLTTKSDVYSFGVVILELLTGKRAIFRHNNSHVSLVDYAVPAIEAGELASIVDPRMRVPTGHEFAAIKVLAEVGSQAVRLRGKDRPGITEIVRRLEQAVILCRSSQAPLPVFGAQIGSSTDPSSSSSSPTHSSRRSGDRPLAAFHLDPAAAALFDKFAGAVEEEGEEAVLCTSGTDVAQLHKSVDFVAHDQVGPRSTSQALLKSNRDFGQDKSDDINLELCRNAQDELLSWPLAGATGWPSGRASAAGSNHAMGIGSSLSSAAAAQAAVYHCGGKSDSGPHPSPRWKGTLEHRETRLQELQESWWLSRLSKRVKFGASGLLGDHLRREGSFYSCEGGSTAVSTTDVPSAYCSRKVVDDPSLDQRTATLTKFSNVDGDLAPPNLDVHPQPPKPSHSTRGELEWSAESHVGDIDMESFREEYSGELAKSTSYAGFSNFSILHDLDELMRALHCKSSSPSKSCRNTKSTSSIRGQFLNTKETTKHNQSCRH